MRLLLFAVLLPFSAWAQVATDDHALDSLPASPPVTKPAPASPAAKAHAGSSTRPAHAAKHPVRPTPARSPGQVRMPVAPPAYPVLAPPPFVIPAHAAPPPPPVPVRADAPGNATPIAGGIRITFGAGVSDLNPGTLASIRTVAAQAIANPAETIGITAWAPGAADDPSTPRRLSLERALAVRAVLINAGMASERIRALAKGPTDASGGALNRADLLISVPK